MQNLVIVESPTKARTLTRFLGSSYKVIASMGHIRDLPKSEIGVDVENNFDPKYIIPRDKRKTANELKKLAKEAKVLWLASDPDREGEAIAWHIRELVQSAPARNASASVAGGKRKVQRVVFHEITEGAIKEAFKHPRDLDMQLVDAQQARRVLDRLVGYKLSPLLWQKIKRGLSAGRVQSVALKLIVEREKEVLAFKPIEYWSVEAELGSSGVILGTQSEAWRTPESDSGQARMTGKDKFVANLIELNGKKLEIKNEKDAKEHVSNLEKAQYCVSKIVKKEVKRNPAPPFTTSTLQQASSNRLGFTAKKTMMLAQNLYEQGLITYMRTDSFNLAPTAITAVREYIGKQLGKSYLPASAKVYKSKSKNAQEAHEAVRPTDVQVQSAKLKVLASQRSGQSSLTSDHERLYDLIWKRFVACQMAEAVMDQTSIDINADLASSVDNPAHLISNASVLRPPEADSDSLASLVSDRGVRGSSPSVFYLFRASGSVIKFDGWLKIYGKVQEEEEDKDQEKEKILPELSEGEDLNLLKLLPEQHFTEPPPRFNEASLIKKLEELGIGRPSTYAPIISTIQERFYVERVERKFIPTPLGFTVTDFLMQHFPNIVDYQFTARMEDELDEISVGKRQWRPTIKEFYDPFAIKLAETSEKAERVELAIEYAGRKCPECGKELIIRTGKFGKFLACSGFPECKHTEAIEEKIDAKCPEDGGDILVRKTRKGRIFYGCKNYPKCKFASWNKPKSATNPEVSS